MKFLLHLLLAIPLVAVAQDRAMPDDFAQAHAVMKEIAIQGIVVSDDRKLPKKDRAVWEGKLSDYVDFEAFNERMRTRVRQTAESLDTDEEMTREHVRTLENKAVIFLVPRTLLDSTVAFLQIADRIESVDACKPEATPGDTLIMCTHAVSADELHVRLVAPDQSTAFRFSRTDRLRLIDVDVPITEQTLMRLAYWK